MGLIDHWFDVERGEYPSERPHELLERTEKVTVTYSSFDGEGVKEEKYGTMSGADASAFLREFDDFRTTDRVKGEGVIKSLARRLEPDYEEFEEYEVRGGTLYLQASDRMPLFPIKQYEKLQFDLGAD